MFISTLLCGASKGSMKALKAFIKPFEAPQRSVNFLSSSGIGTGKVNHNQNNILNEVDLDFHKRLGKKNE